jgi:hypothetical protein
MGNNLEKQVDGVISLLQGLKFNIHIFCLQQQNFVLVIRIVYFKVVDGASKPSGSKKGVYTFPLLQDNNLKNQRLFDEQKLKVSAKSSGTW